MVTLRSLCFFICNKNKIRAINTIFSPSFHKPKFVKIKLNAFSCIRFKIVKEIVSKTGRGKSAQH